MKMTGNLGFILVFSQEQWPMAHFGRMQFFGRPPTWKTYGWREVDHRDPQAGAQPCACDGKVPARASGRA